MARSHLQLGSTSILVCIQRKADSDPLKASKEAIEVIEFDREMTEVSSVTAVDAKLAVVDPPAASASIKLMEVATVESTSPALHQPHQLQQPRQLRRPHQL